MDAITVQGLTKKYKDFSLNQISFHLPKGYILGYVGQNGAGKTTTLKAITHLIHADEGQITINGVSYADNPILFKEQIGYIGDASYYPQDFNVLKIRNIYKDFYTSFDEEVFMNYIQKWKLPLDRKSVV